MTVFIEILLDWVLREYLYIKIFKKSKLMDLIYWRLRIRDCRSHSIGNFDAWCCSRLDRRRHIRPGNQCTRRTPTLAEAPLLPLLLLSPQARQDKRIAGSPTSRSWRCTGPSTMIAWDHMLALHIQKKNSNLIKTLFK